MSMGFMGKKLGKWDDRFYVKAYQLAYSGIDNANIAKALEVKEDTFYKWVLEKPALKEALEQARARGAGTREFMRLVSQRIPDDLKELWEELSDDDFDRRAAAYSKIRHGDRRRAQHLFVHAYISCNFNETKAIDMTGLTLNTITVWKRNDKHFKSLLLHIKECRKEFCENALMEKIHQGDTASIIFANKTLNKDRGYDTRISIDVKGEVEHKNTISLKDLPPERLRELLELARSKNSGQKVAQIEDRSKIEDAEFVVKEG